MIDPTKPVFLKHMIRDTKTGNAYIPLNRPYEPGEIPFRLLTDANAYQDEAPADNFTPVPSTVTQIAPPLELSSSQTINTKLEPGLSRNRTAKAHSTEATEPKTE